MPLPQRYIALSAAAGVGLLLLGDERGTARGPAHLQACCWGCWGCWGRASDCVCGCFSALPQAWPAGGTMRGPGALPAATALAALVAELGSWRMPSAAPLLCMPLHPPRAFTPAGVSPVAGVAMAS